MKIYPCFAAKAMLMLVLLGTAPWLGFAVEDRTSPQEDRAESGFQVRIPNHQWFAREDKWIEKEGLQDGHVLGLVKTQSGDLLMSFLRRPEQFIIRSRDNGKTWTDETNLSEQLDVSGTYFGLFTTLRSGRILCIGEEYPVGLGTLDTTKGLLWDHGPIGSKPHHAFVYEQPKNFVQIHRAAYSDDEGKTWKLTERIPTGNRRWEFSPGSIVELADGTLLATAYTITREEDVTPWIMSSCVLRSRDQGLTWGDRTIIAPGEGDIGNCYNETCMIGFDDGRLMAIFRMNPTHYRDTIHGFRSFSTDAGYTWTTPEVSLEVPAEACMLHASEQSMMHTGVSLSGQTFTVSHDGGRTWAYQGFLWNRRPNRPGWASHYAYAVKLDDDTILTVSCVPNPAKGGAFGLYTRWLRREEVPPLPESRSVYMVDDSPAPRWVNRELRDVYSGGEYPRACKASNGDLLMSLQVDDQTVVVRSTDAGETWSQLAKIPGALGYGLAALEDGRILMATRTKTSLSTVVSDDNGKSWQPGKPIEAAPFKSAEPGGKLLALPGGDLIMTIHGKLDAADAGSSGVVRSSDGGKTWSKATVVGRSEGQRRSFTNMSLLRAANGDLVAAVETRYPHQGDASDHSVSQSVSTDDGQTWTKPLETWCGYQPVLARLPDGCVFLAQSVWTGGIRYEVSTNEAVTWAYQDQVYYNYTDPRYIWQTGSTDIVNLDDETALILYHRHGGGINARWLRLVPHDSKMARERF